MGRKNGWLEKDGYRAGDIFLGKQVLELLLAEKHIKALTGVEVEGRPPRQVAGEMDISENAFKLILRQARERIYEALEVYAAADARCRVLIVRGGSTVYRSDNGFHKIVRTGVVGLTTDRPQPFEVAVKSEHTLVMKHEWVYEVLLGSHTWIVRERYAFDPNAPKSVA